MSRCWEQGVDNNRTFIWLGVLRQWSSAWLTIAAILPAAVSTSTVLSSAPGKPILKSRWEIEGLFIPLKPIFEAAWAEIEVPLCNQCSYPFFFFFFSSFSGHPQGMSSKVLKAYTIFVFHFDNGTLLIIPQCLCVALFPSSFHTARVVSACAPSQKIIHIFWWLGRRKSSFFVYYHVPDYLVNLWKKCACRLLRV